MKIIIHIGTHKTGTSSIQNFCASNLKQLSGDGVFYPLGRSGSRNVNQLAAQLINEKYDYVNEFIQSVFKKARSTGGNKLFFSTESFYAMTSFFKLLQKKQVDDYWTSELGAIKKLSEFIDKNEVEIVCYLRRQDHFYESMYNQFVKQPGGYCANITTFINDASYIGDYYGHLELWGEIFGKNSIKVYKYDDHKTSLISGFMKESLGINNLDKYNIFDKPINLSLNPDVLAFKRILNRIDTNLAERYVIFREVWRISNEIKSNNKVAEFISFSQKKALLEKFVEGNNCIANNYFNRRNGCLFESPTESMTDELLWRELSPEAAIEILFRYRKKINTFSVRTEILLRRIIRNCLERFPFLENSINGLRYIVNRRRLLHERKGTI